MNTLPIAGQAGLGLLEVLATLLILSVGSLGLLQLSAISTASHRKAIHHHRATAALDDLEARIRVNAAGLAAYAGEAGARGCSSTLIPAIACTPEALAAHDLAEWQSRHLGGLPHASASVAIDGVTGAIVASVELRWSEKDRVTMLRRVVSP